MFNSVAFNVVIGLVFIYMLYSLLATIVSEIIVTILGLKARNLKEAIDRMLNDDKAKSFWFRLWDSLRLMKNPKNKMVDDFYKQPEIKYQGSSGIFRAPSAIDSPSFSKSLMHLLFGTNSPDSKHIGDRLREITALAGEQEAKPGANKILDRETAAYVNNLWQDAQGDVPRFKAALEDWFERTMDQAKEWYKRKIRVVLLFLGFFMAWFFYADTFILIKNLSVDKDAREQLVNLASNYVQKNQFVIDTNSIHHANELSDYNARLDSLLAIKRLLEADITRSANILGIGGWPPDTVSVLIDPKTGEKSYSPQVDPKSLSRTDKQVTAGKIGFTFIGKLKYLFRLAYHHFFGFLITAIAISLGAPFWFDLLNKMMSLRTARKSNPTGSNSSIIPEEHPETAVIEPGRPNANNV